MSIYSPPLEDFRKFAAQGNLIPVTRKLLADSETPLSAYRKIRGADESFLFESVEGGERIGRYTFLGVHPYMILETRGEEITMRRGRIVERTTGKLFDVLVYAV